jgi:tetratricopeptide (TPR) repeat protein
VAEDKVKVELAPAGGGALRAALAAAVPADQAFDRERFNDYGIGLLLQGDFVGAKRAFEHVNRVDPKYAAGFVNLGRVLVLEGDHDAAIPVLEKALGIDPNIASGHYFLALALKARGRYDEALTHLRAAAARFPRDKVVRAQIGRLLFLQRKMPEAIAEFEQALRVDPEDLTAHYNLMLCYRALGDAEKEKREEALYTRFKADEASQATTGDYRRLNPEDNLERQPIHEHAGIPCSSAWPAPRRAPERRDDETEGAVRRDRPDARRGDRGGRLRLQAQGRGPKPAPPDKPIAVTYTDVTRAAGIAFTHTNGARGRKYLPETMGSGLVVFDYDGDGRPDLFFVNSDEWPENHGKPAYQALYRNRGDGTFEDTTAKAGLKVEAYAIGAAAADYDNDGDEDLYLNTLGPITCSATAATGRSRT